MTDSNLTFDELDDDEKEEVRTATSAALGSVAQKRAAKKQEALQASFDRELEALRKQNLTHLRAVHFLTGLKRKYRKLGLDIH